MNTNIDSREKGESAEEYKHRSWENEERIRKQARNRAHGQAEEIECS